MRASLPLHLIRFILALTLASSAVAQDQSPTDPPPPEALDIYEAALQRIAAATATASSTPTSFFAELEDSLGECANDPWRQLRPCCALDEGPEAEPPLSQPPESAAPPSPNSSSDSSTDTPTPENATEAPFESFEDWKRRREVRDETPPRPSDNASFSTPPPPPPDGNSTPSAQEGVNEITHDAEVSARGVSPPPPLHKGHRYNYASPDCSARVLASSPLTQHASSLLHKSRDRYMLTPCRANEHWAVVELCDEIRVEAVELAVWEFFSGIVRGVKVSVADDAEGEWEVVGEFVGKNVRGAQTFALPEPTSFHRFLRLDFPSFYGSEYYCPVSQLRVWGMNQMEAFKMEQRRAAEARGAQEEKVRAEAREAERVAEAARVADIEKREREEEEKRQRELCELERLVQEQARRSGHTELFEEPIECLPVTTTTTSTATTEDTMGKGESSGSDRESTSASGSGSVANLSQTHSETATTAPEQQQQAGTTSVYRAKRNVHTDTSESIYAFITRRLAALEGNTTLVARYIDEQAKSLRAALDRAEKKWEDERHRESAAYDMDRMRQEDRLARLNGQLEHMRVAFDAERRSTETQLQLLADELGFERRRSLAQLVVLVSVIVLGVVSRGEAIDALLRPLSAESIRRRARDSAAADKERRAKRLSTGPLAGLLIDVATPERHGVGDERTPQPSFDRDRDRPSSYHGAEPTSPATPRGGKRRLPNTRRRTPGTRSISAAEPGQLFHPADYAVDDALSPTRPLHPSHAHTARPPRGLPSSVPRRRLARSSHLHTMRRRDGSASEADVERDDSREDFGPSLAELGERSERDEPPPKDSRERERRREIGRSAREGSGPTSNSRSRSPSTPTARFRPPFDRLESHGASGGDEWEDPSGSASASEVEDAIPGSPGSETDHTDSPRRLSNVRFSPKRVVFGVEATLVQSPTEGSAFPAALGGVVKAGNGSGNGQLGHGEEEGRPS